MALSPFVQNAKKSEMMRGTGNELRNIFRTDPTPNLPMVYVTNVQRNYMDIQIGIKNERTKNQADAHQMKMQI